MATIPETCRPATAHRRTRRSAARLPSPTLRVLLAIDFLVLFAFRFIAPQLVFFAYDQAGLTTTKYGLVVALSALAMAAGQTALGGLSDRLGRRTVIVGALAAYTVTLALHVPFHTPTASHADRRGGRPRVRVLAPALTTAYLETADDAERSSVLGIRNAVMSAGAFAGPLLLAVVRAGVSPETVFVATGLGLLAPAVVALLALPR